MIEILGERNMISSEDLRILCIKRGWFTGGSSEQYEKLFKLNREGCSFEDLSLVIWICSPGTSRTEILHTLSDKFGYVDSWWENYQEAMA